MFSVGARQKQILQSGGKVHNRSNDGDLMSHWIISGHLYLLSNA